MLKSLKKNYFLLISTFLVLYFFFNLMSGERGLISYFEKKEIIQNLKKKELQLTYTIEELDLNDIRADFGVEEGKMKDVAMDMADEFYDKVARNKLGTEKFQNEIQKFNLG